MRRLCRKKKKNNPLTGGYALGKSGIAYFSHYDEKNAEYQVLSLKPNELKFNKIKIPTTQPILDMAMDKNDNLYVLAKSLYVIKKNSDTPIREVYHYFKNDIFSLIRIKNITDDLYIYNNGVFYVYNAVPPKITKIFNPGNFKKEIANSNKENPNYKSEIPKNYDLGDIKNEIAKTNNDEDKVDNIDKTNSTRTLTLIIVAIVVLAIVVLYFCARGNGVFCLDLGCNDCDSGGGGCDGGDCGSDCGGDCDCDFDSD